MIFRNIIIEGVDRIGKSSLIDGIQDTLGFFQELHYQKPKVLNFYVKQAEQAQLGLTGDALKRYALKEYQVASFMQMFHAISSKGRYLMNRSHLGEFVYAPRYRQYDGSYVFDLETHFQEQSGSDFAKTTMLVLLHSSDIGFITEDGNSLGGLDKRDAEQNDFIRAFERSIIVYKIMVDVCDGQGGFAPKEAILKAVLDAWQGFHHYSAPVLQITWNKREDGTVEPVSHLQQDPKMGVSG